MVFVCVNCGYQTIYKCNLEKHNNRKNHCSRNKNGTFDKKKENHGNENDIHKNVILPPQKRHHSHKNVIPVLKDDSTIEQIVSASLVCSSCKNLFSRIDSLHRHQKSCKGVSDCFKCSTCSKCFSSRQSKYRHEYNNKCKQTTVINHNFTQNNTNTTTNIIDNSVHNTQNNNIQINVFGQEDLSYLLKDKEIVCRINNYSKDGVYGLVRMFDDIFMNKDRPENNTLIKPQDRGEGLYIRQNDEWEYREYEDIKDCIVSSLDRYIDMYQQVKKGNDIKLTDPGERNRVKKLIVLLLTIGGMTNEELCKEFNVDETSVADEDDDKINKKFDKATLNRLYTKTDVLFQKVGCGWSVKKIEKRH
jgi:hypothetical protein